jgi:hypothetical protein
MHGRTLKPVIFRKGIGGKGRIVEGMNKTRVQYMYIWKYHNKTPCITIINFFNLLLVISYITSTRGPQYNNVIDAYSVLWTNYDKGPKLPITEETWRTDHLPGNKNLFILTSDDSNSRFSRIPSKPRTEVIISRTHTWAWDCLVTVNKFLQLPLIVYYWQVVSEALKTKNWTEAQIAKP